MNCSHCGTPLEEDARYCPNCGNTVTSYAGTADPAELAEPERVLPGILGALLGSLIGGASIILLSRLGFVAAISGVLLAFCTLKGYELLGKRLSKRGVILCIIVMILSTVAADLLDWAFVVLEAWGEFGVSYFECLIAVPSLISEGAIDLSSYLSNLGLLMLFVALGAFGTVRSALKGKK